MSKSLTEFFKLEEKGTNFNTELRAGIATFLTMAYIIVVNPAILSACGMPFAGVLFATVLVCSISSILMGLYANLPFGLAPGMGINAFFTFSLVIGMDISWQTALGAVFISGVIFMLLSVFRIRESIVRAIPESIRYAVAAGIGLFLAFIGLKSVNFVVSSEATLVDFGGITPEIVIFALGLFFTGWLIIKKVKGALIYGILGISVVSLIVSQFLVYIDREAFVKLPEGVLSLPSFEVFLKLDILEALSLGMILPVFTLLFTDMFDSISTFVGVAEVGGFIDEETGQPENVGKALLVDAVSTTISGLFGTSSGTTYIESASGIEEGGRTGLTAIVTGILFLPFMFFSPLLAFIPNAATAPILVLIGLFMLRPLLKVKWGDFEEALPAFLALILIPLTYSITHGIIWGFLSYTAIKILVGKAKKIPVTLWIIDIFAVVSIVLTR